MVYFYYSNKILHNVPPVITGDFFSKQSNKENYSEGLKFNKDQNDVLSFVHIQKTGGTTMEKHLVYNILNSNCQCKKTKKTILHVLS